MYSSTSAAMTTHTKAKRSHSMPSRYAMPTAQLGEYESGNERRRSAPARPASGGLFPLAEEGAYGRAPAPPPRPPLPYLPRDRKPKVYSSYNVDSDCTVHAKNLAKQQVE
jgi:hypothetical protein